MTIIEEKLNKINKLLWIVILLTVAFNIIFLTRYNFEADSAFYVILAQEQIRTGSLFPEGMFYSTGMFILTPNLLVIPFLFLTENLVLARQLAILLLWFFIYFIIYKVFVVKRERNIIGFILASSLFSILYVDASVVSMHFYQGAYVTYIIFQLLFLALMNKIIVGNSYTYKSFLGILLLYVAANLGDIRNLLIWGIPGIIAYVIYIYLINGQQILETKKMLCDQKLLRILFDGTLLAFIVCLVVTRIFGTGGSMGGMSIVPAKDFGRSLYAIITGLFNLYGNSYEASLFSSGGIMKVINFFIAIFINFLLPVFSIKIINKVRSESSRFIVIFSLISTFIYLLVVFFTGSAIVEDRYLIPVYNNNILLFAAIGSYFLDNHFKKYLTAGLCFVLLYVFLSNFFYLGCQKDSLLHQKFGTFAQGVEGVTDFLEENGLKYGYATFFNAEEYSVLSDNKVLVHGVLFNEKEIMPYNWLTSSRFYEPDFYTGKTFLMISDTELNHYFPKGISELNLGEPCDVLKFKTFSIFVYNYNISSRFAKGKKVYYLIRGNNSGIFIGNE